MKIRVFIAVIVLAASASMLAQPVRKSFKSEQKFALAQGGALALENPVGNVDVIGGDVTQIEATIITTIRAANEALIEEGRKQTNIIVGGDERSRVLRATVAPSPARQWTAEVAWRLTVPRGTHVRVVSRVSDNIRFFGIHGQIHVNNFNGNILLQDCTSHAAVDSVNGSIIYNTSVQPAGNVMLKTLNGHVTANVPAGADFRWIADTKSGDILTNLPVRGAFFGTTFRGSVNAPGGPTITTSTLMGNVQLLTRGNTRRETQSLRAMSPTVTAPSGMMQLTSEGALRRETVKGFFTYSTNLGDVRVEQILGDAEIETGAGLVQLGSVSGNCKVTSLGGPLQIGEVGGVLNASTRAGNVIVDSARRGGLIQTEGGSISLLYASGATRLISGGGDITVRQAAAPISAATRSGDISVAIDPGSRSQAVVAKTEKGNIVLHVHPGFAADVDATILTSDPNVDTITSDLPGLSISKSQVGGKTQIRAIGKINGGGEKLHLLAHDGRIRLTTAPAGPTVVQRR